MKQKHKQEKKDLKRKLKTPKKQLNQAMERKINIIKRKDVEIVAIKKQLRNGTSASQLGPKTFELQKLRHAHSKLLDYHKERCWSTKTVPSTELHALEEKLKNKCELTNRDCSFNSYMHWRRNSRTNAK